MNLDVKENAFEDVFNLWCGKELREDKTPDEVMQMITVADQLQMAEVLSMLKSTIICELRPTFCVEVLISSRQLGLMEMETAAMNMTVERFREVSGTPDFKKLDEETMWKLLEEDGLGVQKEEEVFEGLMRWMNGEPGRSLRARGLLQGIRFGVMKQEYLETKAAGMLSKELQSNELRDLIEGLMGEALRAKAAVRAKATVELGQLGAMSLTRRREMGVDLRRCSEAGGRHELEMEYEAIVLAECEGRMCCGTFGGLIKLWSLRTLQKERGIMCRDVGCVAAFAVWEGRLISGYDSGTVRVWDFRQQKVQATKRSMVQGHSEAVLSLCVVRSWLVSGSRSATKVWAMGQGQEWPCVRTVQRELPPPYRYALAGWEEKLISGFHNGNITIWDLETGELEATLTGHTGGVCSLFVHCGQLFSASVDGTIRIWAVGTWAEVAKLEAYDVQASEKYPRCLVASGSRLFSVCGFASDEGEQPEIQVWDVDLLTCEHTLGLMGDAEESCLAIADGQLFCGKSLQVLVLGRE